MRPEPAPITLCEGVLQISRIHGRNGIAYVGVDPANGTGGAQILAAPMAFLSDWSINFVNLAT